MNGNPATAIRIPAVVGLALSMLVIVGCGAHRSWPKLSTPLATDQTQRERALRDREAELAGLRGDVANARIAAAKKEAEVQELREQVLRLRQELSAAYQQLAEERAETGTTRGGVVTPSQEDASLGPERVNAGATAAPLRSNVETMLRQLTTEVEGLKRQLQTVQHSGQATNAQAASESTGSRITPPVGATPIHSLTIGFVGAATQSITVEAGDTLADLAQRYHTSEAQLQQMNVLEGETLSAGQVLLVPVPSVEGP